MEEEEYNGSEAEVEEEEDNGLESEDEEEEFQRSVDKEEGRNG